MMEIGASETIRSKMSGLKFGLLKCGHIQVAKNGPAFEADLNNLNDFLFNRFKEKRPAEEEVVGHVRRMYRRVGWEPTKYRPSSEALIRRILQGKGLYRINNLVDYGNIVSARYFLPMGLYDTNKISGGIVVDVGKADESYAGISRPEIHAEGKMILRDDAGVFGNPTADSLRTSLTAETSAILALFFCPPEVEKAYLSRVLVSLADYYQAFLKDGIIETDIFEF